MASGLTNVDSGLTVDWACFRQSTTMASGLTYVDSGLTVDWAAALPAVLLVFASLV